MKIVDITQNDLCLSSWLVQVEAGEDVTFVRAGKPIAVLTPARSAGLRSIDDEAGERPFRRRPDALTGQIVIADDFDEELVLVPVSKL